MPTPFEVSAVATGADVTDRTLPKEQRQLHCLARLAELNKLPHYAVRWSVTSGYMPASASHPQLNNEEMKGAPRKAERE